MLIELKSDALFISQRIKEVDQSYYLVFNTISNKYEVHSSQQVGCTYCLTCPNPALDERLVELAKKTRRENLYELIKEVDKENEKLEKQNLQNQKQILKESYDN